MTVWHADLGWVGHWLSAACVASAVVAGVAGCAHQAAADPGATEPVAGAAESDVRRRARIRLELAANYMQMGQSTVALEEVRQALATDPSYADAFHLRGLVYMGMGDLALAEDSFKRAQAMKPADPDIMHNFGWLLCQRQQYEQADQLFQRALTTPAYAARGKTLMSQGLCYQRAGRAAEAEQALLRAYELEPGNPVVGYQLASVMLERGEAKRAQFYIRRVNNGDFANAQSLWLGIKVERALGDAVAVRQLGDQLHKRFPNAKETSAFDRGAFNE